MFLKNKLLIFIFLFFSYLSCAFANQQAVVLKIEGPIGPPAQNYIQRGIAYAEKARAAIIILQLDTPGGLDTSMRGINTSIITSSVPVIAYVAPSGAHAASAGVFILYASHLAYMAQGTHTGAASPVNLIETSPANQKNQSTAEKKAVNDAAAYIRSLAQLRHRNANWAELAVRQAVSVSATEAMQLKIINGIADNYPELLKQVQGQVVSVNGITETITTNPLQLSFFAHDWQYEFLSFLTNPNIIYLLILVAIYGIFFEFSNPGLILPGVAGVIALMLVLYAVQLIAINYVGLGLIALGICFMILELFVTSYGMIATGGIIAFVIGSIMLFNIHDESYQLTWPLVIGGGILTFSFFFILIHLAIQSQKKSIVTGREGLIGKTGHVLNIIHGQITVRVDGEIWAAQSIRPLKENQTIKVIGIEGLTLIIEPLLGLQD